MVTADDVKALACEDCPADVLVQRGGGVSGLVLTVTVVHEDTCPRAARLVPRGGVMLVKPQGLIRHVRRSEPDVLEDAG